MLWCVFIQHDRVSGKPEEERKERSVCREHSISAAIPPGRHASLQGDGIHTLHVQQQQYWFPMTALILLACLFFLLHVQSHLHHSLIQKQSLIINSEHCCEYICAEGPR